MSALNAALAYRVLDHIDADPNSWLQSRWVMKRDCGTVACFAGWTCLLSGDEPIIPPWSMYADEVVIGGEFEVSVPERAAELLGIEYDEDMGDGNVLFAAYNTREDLGRLVADLFGPRPAVTS